MIINYKTIRAAAILLLLGMQLAAQEKIFEVHLESRLESLLILNIDPDARLEFGVKELNDQLYQITKQPDDIFFSVESTGNWNLGIVASSPYFVGSADSSQRIPVDFIGFTIENLGTNWDNGLFSNMANLAKDTIISLTADKITVLTNGREGNAGGSDQNSFLLRWRFVFEDEPGKVKKFSQLNIRDDYYTGNFYLILSESQDQKKTD